MTNKKILKYFISLMLLLIAIDSFSQKFEWKGINVGADLTRFVVPIIDSTRYGWEVSGDMEVLNDMLAVVEIGSQTTKYNSANYNYTGAGAYTRMGVDYNYMKHLDPDATDQLLVGVRYGFSTFYHEATNITVSDEKWGDFTGGDIARKYLGAQWAEVATGMRARLFNNFYLSWSLRFRLKLFLQNDDRMQPYHIPGYGRAWSDSRIGFNYTLSYKIPLIKKKTAPVE